MLPAGVHKVRELVNGKAAKGDHTGWNDAWSENVTPWDGAGAQPGLLWTLSSPETAKYLPSEGKALVAGCGRGYDPEALAKRGFKPAIGVDIAPIAVQKAKEWFAANGSQDLKDDVKYVEADFFKLGSAEDTSGVGSSFSVAYDYTFFCAIPPSLRADWGKTLARVLRPGGILICLVFPMHGDRTDGPPYSVHPQNYQDVLSDNFELQWEGVPPNQPERKKGVEMVQIWKRKEARL